MKINRLYFASRILAGSLAALAVIALLTVSVCPAQTPDAAPAATPKAGSRKAQRAATRPKSPARVLPVPPVPTVAAPTPAVPASPPPPTESAQLPVEPALQPVPAAEPQPPVGIRLEGEEFVALNFDFADITVVIQTIADLVGMNYILAPGVSGKVTIQTSGKIAVADLFVVLEKILEVNNLAAVKSGDFYKIIPLGAVAREALETVGPGDEIPREQMIIKIFSLEQILPSEVARIFGSLKSPQGVFIPHDPTMMLFVLDSASRLEMFSQLIEVLDVDMYQKIQVELHPVANAQADELAKNLEQVLATVTTAPGRPAPKYKLIPVSSINSLLFVTTDAALGRLLVDWIQQLDQPATTEAEKVFVYSLNHANAENVAGILKELYSETGSGAAGRSTQPAPTAAQRAARDRTISTRTSPQQAQQAQGSPDATPAAAEDVMVSGKVKIVGDKDTNSLIIQTAPWNYPAIRETIQKLDRTPEQVLIEVTIAEIMLDDTDRMGIEWALKSQGAATVAGEAFNFQSTAQAVFNTSGAPAPAVPGFSYLLSEANRLTMVLNAYARASKLNIISRPHIIASDNKEAKIDVGAEVPIITSKSTSSEGTQTDQSVEYRSTGIILTVTPHINENRDVTLDITQEVSEAQTNTLGGIDSPIITKRTAQTSMVVRDNETLIIGGLIQEKKERAREGIPFLSRIPILGYLFGTTTDVVSKTELVLMMTPRVITSVEDANRVTREFTEKTVILKKGLKTP